MSDEVRSFQLALMTRDVECRLLWTFVMLKPMVMAFRSCLSVLSLVDACHMTNSFKGVLLMSASSYNDGWWEEEIHGLHQSHGR